TQLQIPGRVLLAADYAECGGINADVWNAELCTVERVERLGPELHLHAVGDRRVLEQGYVEVVHAGATQVRHQPGRIPKRERSVERELRRVEIPEQARGDWSVERGVHAGPVGTLGAGKRAAAVAAVNGERKSALEGGVAVHLPAADDFA